ncbi:MAG: tetratricopeptide repeat protein [Fibrobacteria bacterium]|nr:tetratricopeptide repeat protein [Fibrobacteria bacterium]
MRQIGKALFGLLPVFLVWFYVNGWSQGQDTSTFRPEIEENKTTAFGIGLLQPLLIATSEKDLWIGAALEERFYEVGKFGKEFFVPSPSLFHKLFEECPFTNARKCVESVGTKLNLKVLVAIRYKSSSGQRKAKIKIHTIGDSVTTKVLYSASLGDNAYEFISQTLTKIFESALPEFDSDLKKQITLFPSQQEQAYGCYVLGYRYMMQQRYTDVFYALNRAIELDPTKPMPIIMLSKAYVMTGNYSMAENVLKNIPLKNSLPWEYDLVKSDLLLHNGKRKQAFKHLKSATAKLPNKISELEYAFGRYYKKQNNPTRGIFHIISAINRNPSIFEYYFTLSELYFQNEEYSAAIPLLKKLMELSPENKKYRLMYGIALRENNQFGLALNIFHELIDAYPYYSPARVNLGLTYKTLGWNDKAEKKFRTGLELYQDSVHSLLNMAVLAFQKGDYQKAKKWMKEVSKNEPENYYVRINLGLIELEFGDFGQAEKHLKNAVEMDSSNVSALLGLAIVYGKFNQEDKEFGLLNKALEIEPENIAVLTQLAEHDMRTGEIEDAVRNLMDVIAYDPSVYRQRLMLGNCFVQLGERESGREEFLFVEEKFSHSGEIQLMLIEEYFKNRFFSMVIRVAEKLIKKDVFLPENYLWLAKSFTSQIIQGKSRRVDAEGLALRYFSKTLEIMPDNWEVHYWYGRFLHRVKRDNVMAKQYLDKSLILAKAERNKELVQQELSGLSQ